MKKTNNPVAKYARDFNKAVVMKDRKKAEKKGDRKHKGKYQEDTDVVEDKKGLWDRIHAKRKRGEAPAKPGDKDYPKTLDVGESTAAYGKSQSSIRDKKKNAGISSSDKNKLGKLSALMSKEKESEMSKRMKRGQRNDPFNKIRAKRNEEVEQVDEVNVNGLSPEAAARKKARDAHMKGNVSWGGKDSKKVKREEVEQVDEAKSPSTVKHKGKTYYPTGKTGKDSKTGAPSFEYSSDLDGDDVRVWYNSKTKKVAMESVQVDEEMSAVERRKHMNLKKRAKQGNSQAKIRLKKFEDMFKDDLEGDKRSAKQSTKAIKGKGAADPHSGQAFTGKGSGAGDDDNLVSQLRKAQDVDGNLDIRLPAGNKTARLPKAIIDKLLAGYDRLQKPEDKKKFKVLLTKELRKKAK
jgi:hypothetical protein